MKTALCLFICYISAPTTGPQAQTKSWDPFLDTLQTRTLTYFLHTTDSASGLAPDRWPTPSPSSVAAVGFALTCYPIAVERKLIKRADAARRTLNSLRFLFTAPQDDPPSGGIGYHGFFYHFVSIPDGTRAWNCELSTIDTALLMAGVLACQSYFDRNDANESSIRHTADSLYRRVDWSWAAEGREGLMLGWTPEKGADRESWRGYNEAMIMYILALGSPTHPVSPGVWNYWTSTYVWAKFYDREFVSFGPLFGHQYSHCWIDYRGIYDRFMRAKGIDYFENSRRATYSHQAYAAENPHGYRGYSSRIWGITPCDGPGDTTFTVDGRRRVFIGYAGRGVSFDWVLDDGTIAPTGAGASLPFAPEICIPALKSMRSQHGAHLWKDFGFVDAFNPSFVTPSTGEEGWYDKDFLGIDQGPIAVMIENHRDGFVWNLMKRNSYIVSGLKKAGFSGGWLDTQTPAK